MLLNWFIQLVLRASQQLIALDGFAMLKLILAATHLTFIWERDCPAKRDHGAARLRPGRLCFIHAIICW